MPEILLADPSQYFMVAHIVNKTIRKVYPLYYPRGAVRHFLRHHSKSALIKAIKANEVYLLIDNGVFVGTASLHYNEISRVFVLPRYQERGYGSALLTKLEELAFTAQGGAKNAHIILHASLPAFQLYINRGYVPVSYHRVKTKNGHFLCYHEMKKTK